MALFGKGVSRICAVVAASTASEMFRQVRLALRSTPTVELRLDWLKSDAERVRLLSRLRKHGPRGATFVATCRSKEGGGKFAGNIRRQRDWLNQARKAGCR